MMEVVKRHQRTLGNPYRCVGCFEYGRKCSHSTPMCAKRWVAIRKYPFPRAIPAPDALKAKCYVYAFRDTEGGLVKIGCSNNPYMRMRSFQSQHGNWLEMAAMTPGTLRTERALHLRFDKARQLGEWFIETAEITDWINEHRHIL